MGHEQGWEGGKREWGKRNQSTLYTHLRLSNNKISNKKKGEKQLLWSLILQINQILDKLKRIHRVKIIPMKVSKWFDYNLKMIGKGNWANWNVWELYLVDLDSGCQMSINCLLKTHQISDADSSTLTISIHLLTETKNKAQGDVLTWPNWGGKSTENN